MNCDDLIVRYCDIKGLAKITGLSPRYIQLKVADGTIPAIKLGRRAVRFKIEDACAALEKFTIRAPALSRRR
jgi:excisionase family DNA binding protein